MSPSRSVLPATSEALPPQDISWDDLKLMVDGENTRPVAWSAHNLLFVSDPVSPTIYAKHLPPTTKAHRGLDTLSQSQFSPIKFTLPLPVPILDVPLVYGSATILTISPQNKYLYAYFPPTQSHTSAGGLACVWEAQDSVDTWNVTDFWHFPAEAGVVSMRWLGEEREWYPQSGIPLRAARYPSLGPKLHMNHPAFLAITQDHNAHLYFRRYPFAIDVSQQNPLHQPFSTLTVSLLSPTAAVLGQIEHTSGVGLPVGGRRVCSKAAIGLGYNDWSIIVATRSSSMPNRSAEGDLAMTSVMGDLLPDNVTETTPASWLRSGMWGEEDMIELCEIEIDVLSEEPCVVTSPLRPISPSQGADQYLTHLFVTSHPLDASAYNPNADQVEISCSFQVVASFLGRTDSNHFRSRLVSWRLSKAPLPPRPTSRSSSSSPSRNKPIASSPSTDWSCVQSAQQALEHGAIGTAQIWDAAGNILLCKLGMSPVPSVEHADCLSIGEISIVSSVTLENNPMFEPEPILRRRNKSSREFPLFVAVSPHKTLLCTTAGTSHNQTLSIFSAPRWKNNPGNPSGPPRMISSAIAIRLRHASGSDMSDVVRALWEIIPKSSMAEASISIQAIFQEVFVLLDSPMEFDVHQPWLPDLTGILLAVYRWGPFKGIRSRWKTASEICQLYASVRALDDSRTTSENGTYDYTPLGIWELIQQARWLIERCESLLRTLVEWENRPFSDETPSELVMAVHPFSLDLLIRALVHLNRLKSTVADLTKTENNQMAIFALSGLIEEAGLDLASFQKALQNAKEIVRTSDIPRLKEQCRESLIALKTSEALFPLLRRVAGEYTQPQVLHRVRLFIPPDDLLVSQTIGSSTSSGLPNSEVDIIRKTKINLRSENAGLGMKTCVRCGGRTSAIPSQDKGNGWRVFESIWRGHCVCGGVWAQNSTGDLLGARI
ncbi:hypothetical protein FRC09_005117 [Ceratobasidium sp. 395]|nr:hypothetical protein FRC09_005117 [Ceratobasidium sp. 395]